MWGVGCALYSKYYSYEGGGKGLSRYYFLGAWGQRDKMVRKKKWLKSGRERVVYTHPSYEHH